MSARPSALPWRLFRWGVALLAFWTLVSRLTWVLPSEDLDGQLMALLVLAAAAAFQVVLSHAPALGFLLAHLAVFELLLAFLTPAPVSLLTAGGLES